MSPLQMAFAWGIALLLLCSSICSIAVGAVESEKSESEKEDKRIWLFLLLGIFLLSMMVGWMAYWMTYNDQKIRERRQTEKIEELERRVNVESSVDSPRGMGD